MTDEHKIIIIESVLNRIKKRFVHRKKWARRQQISCFRVINRDIAEFPFILDWLDGYAVVWMYYRKKDETEAQQTAYEHSMLDTISQALDVDKRRIFIKYRQRQRGLHQQYEKDMHQKFTTIIQEDGLKFELNLSDYLDTGLFLDHRKTRRLCRKWVNKKRFLNLFAYTGSFTCYAIAGGAVATTTVDMSNQYIQWAQRNIGLNNMNIRSSDRFIVANCFSFLKREASKNRYDIICCDPPTFSNSKQMTHSFSIDRDYGTLIESCLACLAPEGVIIFSTNSRSFCFNQAKLNEPVYIKNISKETESMDFSGAKAHQCWLVAKQQKALENIIG